MSADLPCFPFRGSSYRGPAPEFSRLRAECPIARIAWHGEQPAWVITRYAEIKAVLEDPRFSRAATYAASAPHFDGLLQAPAEMIVSLDPPAHTRLRTLVSQAFTAERITAMRPRVHRVVERLLGTTAGRPFDIVSELASPLAMTVICDLLGVPDDDRAQFHGWVRRFANVAGPADEAREAGEELGGYMAALVASKRGEPDNAVISAMIAARDGADRLSDPELIGLGFTLLGAGFDSSAGQLANIVLALLTEHRDEWAWLGRHPEAIPEAVEELLRWVNITANDTSGMPRIATADVAIGSATIREGDAVFLAFASGNRDGAIFPEPDRLDLRRQDNAHLAFGHGIHRCLGASLARLELTVTLRELTHRFPSARLAVPESELVWRIGDVNHNLEVLPVDLLGDRSR